MQERIVPSVRYAALLGNVNRSILYVDLGNGFRIEEWPIDKFAELIEKLHGTAEHDIWFKLDHDWGYGWGKKYRPRDVYVVTKSYEDFPRMYEGKDMEKWMASFRRKSEFEDKETSVLTQQLTKLRLCTEGSIKVSIEVFYEESNGDLEMVSSREEELHCENRLFKIRKPHSRAINDFLKSPPIRTKHSYISFALENFSQSYRVAHIELEFVTLMISLEALFNDGKQELRNKVSRSCAVLLGKTKAASKQIYGDVKILYDKRSALMHTGDKSTITNRDTLLLKTYVRDSLRRVIELNLAKRELIARLTENGFGSYSKIG